MSEHAPAAAEQGGFTNRIVKLFLESNLSLILILLATVVGLAALGLTPREEDPQIVVPLADVYVNFPGHSAAEVEQLVTTPLEKILYQIDGVEYVYSMSREDQALITVRYYVGEDRERSLVKLQKKLDENLDAVPAGRDGLGGQAGGNRRRAGRDADAGERKTSMTMTLRRVAEEVTQRLAERQERIAGLCGGRAAAGGAGPDGPGPHGGAPRFAPGTRSARFRERTSARPPGEFRGKTSSSASKSASRLPTPGDLGDLVVGVFDGRPVFLKDVAASRTGRRKSPATCAMAGGRPGASRTTSSFRARSSAQTAAARRAAVATSVPAQLGGDDCHGQEERIERGLGRQRRLAARPKHCRADRARTTWSWSSRGTTG